MIQATQADIGRRVIYDMRPVEKRSFKGTLVGFGEGYVLVQFAGDEGRAGPLKVISNLRWAK